jgi:glycosyltransferase involved in cell wall biosynthesis
MKISATIVAFNEERNIARAIRSLQRRGWVLCVDDTSALTW